MPTIDLTLPHHRYVIDIAPGSLATLGPAVRDVAPHGRAALVTDANVAETHARTARASLEQAGYDVTFTTIVPGEQHKTLATVAKIYDTLLNAHIERTSPLVALGGGITGDTAGFAAATYLRGIPLIQVPTTLLAMVDASIGGKTGVNVPQGKNLIGAFHQPRRVIIDPDTLDTLPARELRAGLAECVKHAIIRDARLFDFLEQQHEHILSLDKPRLIELLERNVRIKAAVVIEDEKEAGVRAHLNLGHTFAHAIEAGTDYGLYLHGEAVALGLVAAAHLAESRKLCPPGLLPRVEALLRAIGLPTRATDLPDDDCLMTAMRLDKKVAGGRIRLVLPTAMGEVGIFDDIPVDAIAAAWDALR
ncbi:MAG: 3-dehydroquinate synthase [Phycisphaeraceae bacterium]